MEKKLPLLIILIIGSFVLKGQDISTANLKWNVTSLYDLGTNSTSTYFCQFITNGNADISWVQKNGGYITTLVIQGAQGTWADVSKTGTFTFNVSSNGQNGTLTFERGNSGVTITLDFSSLPVNPFRHQYQVSQVTAN